MSRFVGSAGNQSNLAAGNFKTAKERTDALRNMHANRQRQNFMDEIMTYRKEALQKAAFHTGMEEFPPALPKPFGAVCVCTRKRPMNDKEKEHEAIDAVTVMNPEDLTVHKYVCDLDTSWKIEHANFPYFDFVFDERSSNRTVYNCICAPLVKNLFSEQRGRATIFAMGQTGSGKTYTMRSLQEYATAAIFDGIAKYNAANGAGSEITVWMSTFEIYGDFCYDLLNDRTRVQIREDKRGQVCIAGLHEASCHSQEELLNLINECNARRVTHATEKNAESSRSHSICHLYLRFPDRKLFSKLTLVDLAGSERDDDNKAHAREQRQETANINKSLLALKECIRAKDERAAHVPFRSSKLTLVLKDCFSSKANNKLVVVSAISPTEASADHTINTLKYSELIVSRKKKKKAKGPYIPPAAASGGGGGGGMAEDGEAKEGGKAHELSEEDEGPAPLYPSSDREHHALTGRDAEAAAALTAAERNTRHLDLASTAPGRGGASPGRGSSTGANGNNRRGQRGRASVPHMARLAKGGPLARVGADFAEGDGSGADGGMPTPDKVLIKSGRKEPAGGAVIEEGEEEQEAEEKDGGGGGGGQRRSQRRSRSSKSGRRSLSPGRQQREYDDAPLPAQKARQQQQQQQQLQNDAVGGAGDDDLRAQLVAAEEKVRELTHNLASFQDFVAEKDREINKLKADNKYLKESLAKMESTKDGVREELAQLGPGSP